MSDKSENDIDPIAVAIDRLGTGIERNIDRATRTATHLDKTLISLSAGALLFSMTFVGTLAPAKHLLAVLFLSWIAFGTSIVSLIFAIRAEQGALAAAVKNAGAARELLRNEPSFAVLAKMGIPALRPVISESMAVQRLNNCALSTFIAGVLLLGIFVGWNLWLSKP